MEELLTRLEASTGERDPQLVADILTALGHQACDRGKLGVMWRPNGVGIWHNLPDLLHSVDAALALIGEKLPGWKVSLFIGHMTGNKGGTGARAELHSPTRYRGPDGLRWPKVAACYAAPTPSLALILALLKGVQSRDSNAVGSRAEARPAFPVVGPQLRAGGAE